MSIARSDTLIGSPPDEGEQTIAALPDNEFLERFLEKNDPRSIEDIAQHEGVAREDIGAVLGKRAAPTILNYRDRTYMSSLLLDVDIIFELYLGLQNITEEDPLFETAQSLASFNAFKETYLPNEEDDTYASLRSNVHGFMDANIPHIMTVKAQRDPYFYSRTFGYQGDWVRLVDHSEPPHTRTYVNQTVIQDAVDVQAAGGLPQNELFHGTGSATLEGVVQHGVILNLHHLRKLGQPLLTVGGYESAQDALPSGEPYGSTDVYVTPDIAIAADYTTTGWFDEFPVIFGIDKPALLEYLESRDDPPEIEDHGPLDGMTVGPEVPLETVTSLYTWRHFLPDLTNWSHQHRPDARLFSIETAVHYQSLLADLSALVASPVIHIR